DIGPFGVITLVVVLAAQVLALGQLVGTSPGTALAGAAAAWAVGRLAVTLSCTPRVPSARPEGLGALVAGTVSARLAAAGCVVVAVVCAMAWLHSPLSTAGCVAGVVAGLLVAGALLRRSVRRLGGITGDVLGALVESATAAALVTA
ncbi:adenosylcobinamide-GDP ribazoletransferase, partial [Nocardiopsis lucentensis]|uniref:adenosylcobinamide-GDP ribazoletransferase n=1 Tax=Nocardiopsis lucentensis TaxID=53441 RepID=UPI00036ABF31